jgi:hypothetical protein
MNTVKGLTIVAGLCLAGAAFAQTQTTPDQPTAGGSMTDPASQAMPGSANPNAQPPDQANPATYPAPANSGNSDPSSASSPHQRSVTSDDANEQAATQSPDPSAASTPHQRDTVRTAVAEKMTTFSPGMGVQTRAGKDLGTVSDVVSDSSGQPAYVVIADENGRDTAIPYAAARNMVHGTKLIVDGQRLKSAPKVPESQLEDKSNTNWQGKADSYWKQGTSVKDRG